ncbi:MAG TPA: transglutaminase domain-containing protein, partial [Chitinophagaceae bacterium]|nr:transglutaminase domain-containing protein [Chitinophagaceae bacterium]
MKKSPIVILLVVLFLNSYSQKSSDYKFAKITTADLEKRSYEIDSNTDAVVLADVGRSEIVGNNRGWFSLEFTRHKRVHILNKSGYNEADFEVYIYADRSVEEEVNYIRGVSYNLEDGKIVETKMDKSAVFTNKVSRNKLVKKFTLPNVKEGTIIDIEYKTTSPFLFNLEPWSFQGSAPALWSEYKLTLPEFFGYIFIGQGYIPFFINEKKERRETYHVADASSTQKTEREVLPAAVSDYRWVMKNVPELKAEKFTSTLKNHIARLEFQLSEYRYPLKHRQVMRSWPQFTKELLEDDDFGKSLSSNNNWMSDELRPIVGSAATSLQKAKNIFNYVRDNFVCTGHNAIFIQQPLRNVFKSKKGTVSELNLLLTSMLRHEKIDASPVLLSTREHGYSYELYPIINRFNYVVCHASIDNQVYYLDASHAQLGFGKMPSECYNGWARIINETSAALDLSADSLKESKVTSLFLMNDKGKWSGNFSQNLGYYESYQLRTKVKEDGEESVFKELKKTFGENVKSEEMSIDSLKNFEVPVKLNYMFAMPFESDDIMYINPLFGEAQKDNPFKSADRVYPVEMPYTMDETYIATIHVPEGYEVDELPK